MERFDLAIIGGGVGGYVAAIRASQLGMRVALIEERSELGGTCLNVGCIPSKALLESSEHYWFAQHGLRAHGVHTQSLSFDLRFMMKRKREVVRKLTDGVGFLMKRHRVHVVRGRGVLTAADTVKVLRSDGPEEIQAHNILLATGSEPVELPFARFDGKHVVSSTEALSFERVPKSLLVVGAGAVGLELGAVWARLGAKVTVVEQMPQIAPFADRHTAQTLQRALKQQGLKFRLKTTVSGAEVVDGRVQATLQGARGAAEQTSWDVMLVAVGRRPRSADLGLEALGVTIDERRRVVVDEHLATNVPSIYAVGDLVPGPMLAHKAEEEGVAVAEHLAGVSLPVNHACIPSVVYTQPELARVGLDEHQAKEQGLTPRVGRFLLRANGRALAMGETNGMVKVVAAADDARILGVHIVGPNASELIAEAVVAMEMGATAEDLARTVHAHPTLSEAVREAALAVHGRALHG